MGHFQKLTFSIQAEYHLCYMMEHSFLIRSVQENDIEDIYHLSQSAFLLNLPADREILKEKITTSLRSFSEEIEDKFNREYFFVMEDLENQRVIGTAMIIARHGNAESPHMYLKLKEVQKYSSSIHFGIIHKVLRLCFENDGPTEIGSLIVDPGYRNHPEKLGRQISFSRFLFIKAKRRWFKNHILSELMPPLTENGESILWEALGRKFTNLSYQEADLLSRKNKEFVTSLFPKGDIYTCLLPGEARDAIGRVGGNTEPVKHMLEKIGFRWNGHIDPFDGGPHYLADTDKILPVQYTKKVVVGKEVLRKRGKNLGLCATFVRPQFCCIQTSYEFEKRKILLPKQAWDILGLEAKQKVYLMPFDF